MPVIKILANENVSPKTVRFLNSLGFEAKRITDYRRSLKDREIIEIALKEKRIIITFDLDYGEIFYRMVDGKVGIWVLRIKPQTVEAAEETLTKFINSETFNKIDHYHTLVILSKTRTRLRYPLG